MALSPRKGGGRRKGGLPLAISTPEWRFLSEDAQVKALSKKTFEEKQKTLLSAQQDEQARRAGEEDSGGHDAGDAAGTVGEPGQRQRSLSATAKNAFLEQLGEELADGTVPKDAIIGMLEEAVGGELEAEELEETLASGLDTMSLHLRTGAGERVSPTGNRGAGAGASYGKEQVQGAGGEVQYLRYNPQQQQQQRSAHFGDPHVTGSSQKSAGSAGGRSPLGASSDNASAAGVQGQQVVQDASHFVKNPRYMRQIREVARRTSLGTIQGLSVKRNRNYREPRKVPAVLGEDKDRIAEEDEFWSDEDPLAEDHSSIQSHSHSGSPTGLGRHAGAMAARGQVGLPSHSPKKRDLSPGQYDGGHGGGRHGADHSHLMNLSPKLGMGGRKEKEAAARPQSPVIIWRPNASVRLASDLPRECLNKSILNPQQDMKLTDLIKSDRDFDPSLLKSQQAMPAEMKKTFSYYKQFVSNTLPSADEEKEVLRSNSRPEWGKRIPPDPKSEYV